MCITYSKVLYLIIPGGFCHTEPPGEPIPSYAVGPNSSETGKECEYQYDYVQTDDGLVQHDKVVGATTSGGEYDEVIDPADNVNIDPNPSYALPQDVKLEDNPSYDS